MKPTLRTILAPALVGVGVLATLETAWMAGDALGVHRWILCTGAFFVVAGAVLWTWPRREEPGGIKARMAAQKRMEAALEVRARRVAERHQELTRQLVRLHEWSEFPGVGASLDSEVATPPPAEEIGEKDRAVAELLEKRAQILFEKIKTNAYQENGVFLKDHLAGDMVSLIEDVARVYNPDSKRPLLETSLESLLRAANRISLQLLLLLEGLPLDIKSYNLQTTYEKVRKGVRAYDFYKSAQPYLSMLRPFYYFGRYAAGAAPQVIGAGWVLSEIVTRGTRQISASLANRYALGLMGDLVLIVGGEAAFVFGGDGFRRRNPDWIYGTELTEFAAACPLSSKIFKAVLHEIGKLSFGSEYDRIFLYHCIADGRSAGPGKLADALSLPLDQREAIARRLEKFHKQRVQPALEDESVDFEKWRQGLEARMGVTISEIEPQAVNVERTPVDVLADSLWEDSPERRINLQTAQTLLSVLEEGESPKWLYRSISLKSGPDGDASIPFPPWADAWLMGTDWRALLLLVNKKCQGLPILVWTADRPEDDECGPWVSFVKGRFRDTCRLTGGVWHWDRIDTALSPEIWLSGPTIGRSEPYFRPLTTFFNPEAAAGPSQNG